MKKIVIILSICLVGIIVYIYWPGYVVFMGKVYYNRISEGGGFKHVCVNANAQTFRVDKSHPAYAMDENNAYYFGEKISASDGLTFEILCGSYQKDINHVYYQNHIIPSADPTTFKASPWDSAGVEPLCFAEDKYDFYYCGNPIGVHDRDSFKQYYIGGYLWGCDSSYCYCQNNKSMIRSRESFKVLKSGIYAKDGESVFFLGKIIEGADGKTFRETKLFCGEDKNGKYDMGHRTNQ